MSSLVLTESTKIKESKKNPLFPVFLKLDRVHILLVGAGYVGFEKLNALLANCFEAHICIVADQVSPDVFQLAAQAPHVEILERKFEDSDLEGISFVILASNDPALHIYIAELATERGLLLNVADTPDLCDVYLGSVVQKGDLKVGISTNGKSPTIAKRLKEVLQDAIPDEIDDTLQYMHQIRNRLNGDFAGKVRQLNALTQGLVVPQQRKFSYGRLRFLLWAITFLFLALSVWVLWQQEPFFRSFVGDIPTGFYYFLGAGFMFALIDGAIGMSYGVTTTTFSLSMGIPPASASMGVHISEILSNGVAGWMHYRLKNVNLKMFKSLVLYGSLGAIIGASLLASLEHYAGYIRPVISIYTLILGLIILNKSLGVFKKVQKRKKITRLEGLGLGGGFMDAIGGGGWGSIVLSTLIAGGRNARYALGSVKLSRFFIALFSSLTFLALLKEVHWYALAGLIIGSVLAAPIAVKISHRISVKVIMVGVGIIVILASLYNIYKYL